MDRALALVVGGGPAGASCAWRLARGGADVTVVERSEFPRRKVCAGALGHRGASLLVSEGMISAEELESHTLLAHRTMSCWFRYDRLRAHSPRGPSIRIVDRDAFDAMLVRRSQEAGARVLEGEAVAGLGPGEARTETGRRLGWDYLVVADGAAGSVGRRFRRKRRRRSIGLGVQAFVPGGGNAKDGLQIHFGLLPWGYGWVFPRGADTAVGIGGTGGCFQPRGLGARMPELLRHSGGTGREKLEGGAIPSGPPARRMGRGRIYLAGDAAGLADRISGEGISHAIESGLLVARAILRGGDRPWLLRQAGRGCLGLVRQSRIFAGLLYHPRLQPRAMRRLREDEKFFQGYWDLVAGSTSYWRMMLRFLRA